MKSAAVQFVKKDWGGSGAGTADSLDPLRPFPSKQETLRSHLRLVKLLFLCELLNVAVNL